MSKKILILYAPFGAGHESAANAIAEFFKLNYRDIEVKKIDVLDFVPELFKNGLTWTYNQTTSRVPVLYRWAYNYYNYRSRLRYLNNLSRIILKKSKFVDFIHDFNPDFIISTNPLPMQLVSLTKEKNIINILSANVCTDFGFHPLWHNKDVNYYFVANEETKNSLIKYGVDVDKIQVTGIPTALKFQKIQDRDKIVKNLGFDPADPILLIVGGRISYRNLLKIVKGTKEKIKNLNFIVVTGRDKLLQKKLEESEITKNSSVRVFGFINNLEDYMEVADLILTKAGGLTVSECLVKNLPIVFSDIIPGQEEDNVKYAVKNKFGIKALGAKKSIEVINKIFYNKNKLATMKENCKKVARPKAASDIVDFINKYFCKNHV